MAIDFHELVLDESYAPSPSGGPEFSHSVFSVPSSGLEDINRNRPTALHRYRIPYHLLTAERQAALYSLHLVVGGIGGGFRFLAPEPHNQRFEDEPMAGTVGGGNTVFRLQKVHTITAESWYGGAVSSYAQRIVKPIYNEVGVYVAGAPAVGTMDWTTGTFTFDVAPVATPRATGRYHLPVRFAADWFQMTHDVTSQGDVEVIELLPKTLGIV